MRTRTEAVDELCNMYRSAGMFIRYSYGLSSNRIRSQYLAEVA
jgi:hypothetical protein